MIERRVDISQSGKVWMVLAGLTIILYALWQLSSSIAVGSPKFALVIGSLFVAFFVAGRIANDWRSGVYLFFVWLIFEDLIRKYMGNSMYVYFVKDVLVGLIYFSMLADKSRRNTARFQPPFKYALVLFFLLGLTQVFNPLSPSVFYGVLGLKLYFYYVPLMFVGYSMLRAESDLRRFLVLSMALAAVVSLVGILQTFVGQTFLNPSGGADIDALSHLVRSTPSGLAVMRPPSVFVSDGRFAAYLIVTFILGVGTTGFLLLRSSRGRKLVFPAVGLVALATVLSGGRGAVVYVLASSVMLPAGMLWGAPRGVGDAYRLVKAIRRSFIFVALAAVLAVSIFPEVVSSHWAFYAETVMPGTETSESGGRVWAYPLHELKNALADPAWVTGHGIGTASLGVQYVSRILEVRAAGLGGENGYGELITELGILGPILWLTWSTSLMVAACRVMLKLKGTWAFPVALSITWFAFILLFTLTWAGLVQYQNFITNAYFWLLVGVLFRLPGLVKQSAGDAKVASGYTG